MHCSTRTYFASEFYTSRFALIKIEMAFKCGKCEKVFSRKDAQKRHEQTCGNSVAALLQCLICLSVFSRRDALVRHHKAQHPRERLPPKSGE